MTRRTTGPLADFGGGDLAAAGGKGAALGELLRQGFPVPPGFVIITDAYRLLLARTGLGAALDSLTDQNTDDGGALRALFARFGMPAAFRVEIGEAYRALGSGAVAVRSSATAEDLPGAAFAGQQDTYLNVVGEEAVAKAVTDCWASLWTDRAIAYRRRQGTSPREVAIAVVVQQMVPADAAGVMFSANPVTGERGEIVVDASPGLGEAVVSGRVTPERYLLDRRGKVRSFVPGGGEVVVSPVGGGGTKELPGSRSPVPCLAAAQLRGLADLACRAQEHFGRPQDIEWALAGGRIHVLQSRPMTALPLRLMLVLLGRLKLASALAAGAETRTSQANRALEQLAAMVRADPGLASAFASSDAPPALLQLVQEDPAHAAFREALARFLREFGNRETVSVVLSSSPTWSDNPEVVLGLVTALLGQRPRTADQTGAALAALKGHPLLRLGPVRRQVLAAVEAARAGMAFREDSHFYATKVIPPMRRAYRELGRRLVAAGVLDDAKDVYHLRFEELEAITDDGGALPPSVRQRYRPLVQARAAKRRELEGMPLLDTALLFTNRRRAPGVLVSGTPASRGRAEGPVRIIRGPEEFGRLRSGDVLVCPYTNPSWTPLFQRAAAVVVDMGGLGSHAAIVAREYGIPAVMGTGTGTGILA
jgi:phosphohistidine swiveling domain-containing protein